MIWTFYRAMVRPLGDSIYPRYSQEVMWNSHLSAWAKSPLAWSLHSTSWTWALWSEMLLELMRMSSKIYDDYDVNHICKNVIHKSLKSSRCISKPFRHYQPLEWTIAGLECIHLQVQSIQGGTCSGDQSWCRLMPFMVHLGGLKWAEVGISLSWKFGWGLESWHRVKESCLSSE